MVYENITQATEEFDSKHYIGEGGCGSVYKAELSSGQVVAVKKLHTNVDGGMSHLKAFTSEIRALTEIRHRNIVKLYGFCSHPQHSFLVYNFLEGGSVRDVLSNEEKARSFDWRKRVNVVKGVANALSYMHHDCTAPIIHQDISS
nr:MDIS1-interacting receptor like kinase 2-like [Ziziphus jujuba var. spinosa]